MSFIVFAWIGVIFFGLEIVVSKLILKHGITNPWLFNFVASCGSYAFFKSSKIF